MTGAAILLVIANLALGAFEYGPGGPERLMPYDRALADFSMPGPSANPSSLAIHDSGYVSFSGSRPYSLDELTAFAVTLGIASSGKGAQLSWGRFGIDGYREDTLSVSSGWRPFGPLSAGVSVDYMRMTYRIEGLSASQGLLDFGASLLFMPHESFSVTLQQNGILSAFRERSRGALFPESSFGVSYEIARGFGAQYNLTRTGFGYINSFSVSANIMKNFSLKIGYSRETTSYSSAFTFIHEGVSASYGYGFHQHLGSTHSFSLTLATGGKYLQAMEYREQNAPARGKYAGPKIDIRKCTGDEIMSVPGISELSAGRIVRYREMFGPVPVTALYQIGMEKDEIDALMEHAYGFEEAPDEKKDWKPDYTKKKKSRNDARMKIFSGLLNTGLRAAEASELAGLAAAGEYAKLYALIESMNGLTAEQKSRVRYICDGK